MTEQELRELKIKTLTLAGFRVHKTPSLWWALLKGGDYYDHKKHRNEGSAWDAAPDVTRSLDACAPLIEEVNNEGYEIVITFQDAVVAQYVHCAIYLHRYDQNGIEEDCSIICDETLKYEPLHSAATALCLAYHKFKELTTEVSTANAKTNAI